MDVRFRGEELTLFELKRLAQDRPLSERFGVHRPPALSLTPRRSRVLSSRLLQSTSRDASVTGSEALDNVFAVCLYFSMK